MERNLKPYQKRILDLDPTYIFDRITVDKYKRVQSIPITEIFPKIEGICSCGCGEKLTGRRTRWAKDECQAFAVNVQGIINGHPEIVSKFLKIMFGEWACCECGEMEKYKEYKNGMSVSCIHKDHKLAVKNGGGGCWLDNYQLLCDVCHKEKTKKE